MRIIKRRLMIDVIISQTGRPYVYVKQGDRALLYSLREFNRTPGAIDGDLRQAGIRDYTGKNGAELRKRVNAALGHEYETVAEHVGWVNENVFCDHLGNISTRGVLLPPKSAVMLQPMASPTEGSLANWLQEVAKPLTATPCPSWLWPRQSHP